MSTKSGAVSPTARSSAEEEAVLETAADGANADALAAKVTKIATEVFIFIYQNIFIMGMRNYYCALGCCGRGGAGGRGLIHHSKYTRSSFLKNE
jgi:hypothetical protein